jgi:hypothetical protein
MFGMMQHSNPFINLFVSKTFSYFEPKMEWQIPSNKKNYLGIATFNL